MTATHDTDRQFKLLPAIKYRSPGHPVLSLELFKSGGYEFYALRDDPRVPSRYNCPYSVRVYTAPSCTRVARVQAGKGNRPRGSAGSRLHNDMVWASGTCLTRSWLLSASFSISYLPFSSQIRTLVPFIVNFQWRKRLNNFANCIENAHLLIVMLQPQTKMRNCCRN